MSHFRSTPKRRPIRIAFRIALTLALGFALVLLFANSEKAKTVYEIKLDNKTYTVQSYSDKMDDVLDEAGLQLSSSDCVDTSANAKKDTVEVSITHKQYVTVTCDGAAVSVLTDEGETVSDVLDQLNIKLGKNDLISKKLTDKVTSGNAIVINRVKITHKKKVKHIAYRSKRVADAGMAQGAVAVTQKGVKGKTIYTYELKSIDGAKQKARLIKKKTIKPVTKVTSYGTRVPAPSLSSLSQSRDYITNIDNEKNTITTVSGNSYRVKKKMTCSATAYTAPSGSRTSTGRMARVGVIAVDPSVIPYGSKLYIQTSTGSVLYGTAVAGDCGGAVKGKIIDLYFNSLSQCCSFGRRNCNVYIIG